jgi:hypothetical protein
MPGDKSDIEGTCKDCGQTFVFTVEEQERFEQISSGLPPAEKLSPPKRCKACRNIRRNEKNRR